MNSESLKKFTESYPNDTLVFLSNMSKDYTMSNPLESRISCDLAEVSNLYCNHNSKHTVQLKELRALNNKIISIDIEDGFVFRDVKQILFIDDYIILL